MSFSIRSHPFVFAAVAGLAISSAGVYVWHEEVRPTVLEVYFLSLKGSPAIFIRTPEDKRILINGGANSDVIQGITKILPFYSRRIDMVIATKDDAAHVSGLIDVISRYLITDAYILGITLSSLGLSSTTDAAYQTLLNTLTGLKIEAKTLKEGDSIQLDSKTVLNTLFPTDSSKFMYSKASAPEVLFRVTYKSTSVMFMGDATPKVQKYIASSSSMLSSRSALFIPQSIDEGNIAPQLLEKLRPQILIYSEAPPKPTSKPRQTISFQNKYNLQEQGILKVVSDGRDIRVEVIR